MSGDLSTQRPSFHGDLLKIPKDRRPQVLVKFQLPNEDPHADGCPKKKKLEDWDGAYRVSSGTGRIFCTFDETHVSLSKLAKRDEGTYDDLLEAEMLRAPDPEASGRSHVGQPNFEGVFAPPIEESRSLPQPVTGDIQPRLWALDVHLIEIETEDELGCPRVPDEYLLQLYEHTFFNPLEAPFEDPELIAESADELFRFAEGDLPGRLFRLSPGQEKLDSWTFDASGPTRAKGGLGTGRSTVALYRVREMLRILPYAPAGMDDEARRELLLREHPTMVVPMTRPMRALLVLLPDPDGNPLFDGSDELSDQG